MAETVEELLDLALKSKEFGKKTEYCTKYLELNPKDRDVWDYKGDLFSAMRIMRIIGTDTYFLSRERFCDSF